MDRQSLLDGIIDLNNAYYSFSTLLMNGIEIKSMECGGQISSQEKIGYMIIRDLIDAFSNRLIEKAKDQIGMHII